MSGPHFHLECRGCGSVVEPGTVDYRCAACGDEYVVRYVAGRAPLGAAPAAGMWRFAERLPLADLAHAVSLGEGDTPLVELPAGPLGVASVRVKCEHLNPTGSFKDRIASVALSIARERGLAGCVGTSSGNGGAAAAAYAAAAGLTCALFALADTAEQKLLQIRALRASVHLVTGLGHDAAATDAAARTIAGIAAETGLMPMLTGGRFSPEAMEGAATIAYEILDRAPGTTVVYAPVGGGGLVSAIGRGFANAAGAPGTGGRGPRVVGVQPAGCPTLRAALDGDLGGLTGPCETGVSGLQVAILFDGRGAVEAVRGSGGHLTEVTDEQIHAAQRALAGAGLLVEPAGATAYAGALADAAAGRLGPDDRVVLVATGAGYKDSAALARLADGPPPRRITADQIREAIAHAAS
ncbi:pyridoxal-phosphate dependent enzyme [Luedemannella helvata]|uniref:Threonine synthase n=1 Tax=Luedemannella helvata TaxID=349315 RepID=A0ABN2JTJ4_9ACTN